MLTASRPRLITALTLKNATFTRSRSSGLHQGMLVDQAAKLPPPRLQANRANRGVDTPAASIANSYDGHRRWLTAAIRSAPCDTRTLAGTLWSPLPSRSFSKSWQA